MLKLQLRTKQSRFPCHKHLREPCVARWIKNGWLEHPDHASNIVGIMEKKMETTKDYRDYIGITEGVYIYICIYKPRPRMKLEALARKRANLS